MSDHQAENAHNALLAAAIMAMSEPVLLYDDKRVVFANDAARRMLGARCAEEVDGLALDALLVPELEQVSADRREYVMRQSLEIANLPMKIRTLDGRILHVQVNIRPVTSGGLTLALAMLAR